MSDQEISEQEMKDALKRSGYFLEGRLEAILRRRGYYIELNCPYKDRDTGKSRELDLYAIRATRCGPNKSDYAFSVLLVECVHAPQPTVFFTRQAQAPFLNSSDIRVAGLPVKIIDRSDSWISIQDFLKMDKYHHYCRPKIASQYCSFKEKKEKEKGWVALHLEEHFDTISSLCKQTYYFQEKHFRSWHLGKNEPINLEFYYPILVIDGPIFEARQTRDEVKLEKTEHVNFRRSVHFEDEQSFHIDVVTENYFTKNLTTIEKEMEMTTKLLKRKKKEVVVAKERIMKNVSKLKSSKKIAGEMAF